MRPSSLWILSIGFAVLAVPAHATPRGADTHEARDGRPAHASMTHASTVRRDTLTIGWESNGRAVRSRSQPAVQIRNDDLPRALRDAYQTGRSIVAAREPAQQSVLVLPGLGREQIDLSTVPSRRENIFSSTTSQVGVAGSASSAPVPEPTGAILFGGGLVLAYTFAVGRRERV